MTHIRCSRSAEIHWSSGAVEDNHAADPIGRCGTQIQRIEATHRKSDDRNVVRLSGLRREKLFSRPDIRPGSLVMFIKDVPQHPDYRSFDVLPRQIYYVRLI